MSGGRWRELESTGNLALVATREWNLLTTTSQQTPSRYGRFVRYAKHRDHDSDSFHEDTKTKLVHKTDKDEKSCTDDDEGGTLKHLGWFKTFIRKENRDDSEVLHKKVYESMPDNEGGSEADEGFDGDVEEEESEFDGREDFQADANVKVARSVDASYLDPGSAEVCEGDNCKGGNNNGQERALGFMDTSSGNSKKTSNIALKAAQEAMAAESAQETAGKEASKQAKFQLAEKAIQAAKAGQAALSAKQSIVEQLERELRESEVVVQDMSSSIQQSEVNTNAAMRAAQQAAAQLKMLTEAVQMAQSNLGNSEQAAQGAQQELAEKTQLLEAAKNRVEALLRELKAARADYASTKQAAYKAASAAKSAKSNAWVQMLLLDIPASYAIFVGPVCVAPMRPRTQSWCRRYSLMPSRAINESRHRRLLYFKAS